MNLAIPNFFHREKNLSLDMNKAVSSIPIKIAYCFLALPMYIFMFGWLKLPFAILAAAVLTVGLLFAAKNAPEMDISFFKDNCVLKVTVMTLIAAVWVYLSGIGIFAFQNFDHMWRNAILETLVNNNWPVIITDTKGFFNNPVTLIYYFALWLPAALFGKIFGLAAAHTFLYFWCTAEVLLIFTLILGLVKKFSPWILIAFVFFSGLDTVGDFILNNSPDFLWFTTSHIENWANGFQFSSMSTQLFWVYNQAIPAWLITLLFLYLKDNKSIIFIFSFSFISCSLPAIGMIPVAACIGIRRIIKMYDRSKTFGENVRPILLDIVTFQNMAAGLMVTLISYLFIKSNSTALNGFHMTDINNLFMPYLIFTFLEFVVFYIAIYKYQRKNALYYVTLASLLIIPLIRFGTHIDFCMRASIPSLVVLFVLIMKSHKECCKTRNKRGAAIITALLVLGGMTAYHEISRSVCTTVSSSMNPDVAIEAQKIDLLEDGCRNNFFGEFQDSFFFKYLAKK